MKYQKVLVALDFADDHKHILDAAKAVGIESVSVATTTQ